jgi:hypothetical protein
VKLTANPKMAVQWFRLIVAGFSQRRTGSAYVGFVVEKVELVPAFLQVLRFSPADIIPPWLSILIHHLWMNNRSVGGRSSETWSHPIDMINNNNPSIVPKRCSKWKFRRAGVFLKSEKSICRQKNGKG